MDVRKSIDRCKLAVHQVLDFVVLIVILVDGHVLKDSMRLCIFVLFRLVHIKAFDLLDRAKELILKCI